MINLHVKRKRTILHLPYDAMCRECLSAELQMPVRLLPLVAIGYSSDNIASFSAEEFPVWMSDPDQLARVGVVMKMIDEEAN